MTMQSSKLHPKTLLYSFIMKELLKNYTLVKNRPLIHMLNSLYSVFDLELTTVRNYMFI